MVKVISKVSAGKVRKGEMITLSKEDADYWIAKGLASPVYSEKPIKAPVIKTFAIKHTEKVEASVIKKGTPVKVEIIERATSKKKTEKAEVKLKRKRK